MRQPTKPEQAFLEVLKFEGGIPAHLIEREYRFHPTREWRADFHIKGTNILLEMEGGTRSRGRCRHTSFHGYQGDCSKYSEASALGYIIIRSTPDPGHMGEMARLAGECYRRATIVGSPPS